jgi:hypothetical protein
MVVWGAPPPPPQRPSGYATAKVPYLCKQECFKLFAHYMVLMVC